MANNTSSNVTQKVMKKFVPEFKRNLVLCKTVDTQMLEGEFNPHSGATVSLKRPHDYNTIETSDGDISGSNKSDIIAGKVNGVVQDYITVATEWGNVEEALHLGQLDKILAPMVTRLVTKLELNLGRFMQQNLGLSYGVPGNAVGDWGDVAGAGAVMESYGVPTDSDWSYVMNPYNNVALAASQTQLASGKDSLVTNSWEKAQLSADVGGFRVMKSNALKTLDYGNCSTRAAGSLQANPDVTYVTHKDTMIQAITIKNMGSTQTVNAGEIVEFQANYARNLASREVQVDAAGNQVKFRAVVAPNPSTGATTYTVDGSGHVALYIAGPAIYEANGQYNTVDAAPVTNDAVHLLGSANTSHQPSLFYHRKAIGLATVKLPKLYATDTVANMEEGFSIRCTKYADGDANKQMVRFDLLPAFACFNPFFGGQGFGTP